MAGQQFIESYRPTSDAGLRALLDYYKIEICKSINCVLVGKIAAYDKTTNTASVSISAKRQYADSLTPIDFPLLTDCPVFILQGGGSFIDMPIKKDDHCIVLFNDRDIDAWWHDGRVDVPNSLRAHSLSDGMVLVGIQPSTSPVPASGKFGLQGGENKVYIANALADLKTTLDTLIDKIALMSFGYTGPSGAANTGPSVNAAEITAIKIEIAKLLEAGP